MKCTISEQSRISIFNRSIRKLGKVNEDIIFCADPEFVTIFAHNSTFSSRPVLRFKSKYFTYYEYTHSSNTIIYQITAKSITDAIKDISSPSCLNIDIDPSRMIFSMSITDRFNIIHKYNLFLQEAVSRTNAVFNNSLYQTSKITLSFEALKEMDKAFKDTNNMTLYILKRANVFYIKFTPYEDEELCLSDLKIRNNPNCKIEMNDNSVYPLTFSYSDFKHVLDISNVFGNKFELYTSFPGSPIVIRGNFSNYAEVESAIATMSENETTAESTNEYAEILNKTEEEQQQKEKQSKESYSSESESESEKEDEKQQQVIFKPTPEPPKIPFPFQMSQSQEEWSQSSMNGVQSSLNGTQVVPWPSLVDFNKRPQRRNITPVSASQSEGSTFSDSGFSDD